MPRAKPKKEKLQVKEAKPVTRRGKMANESTAATVVVKRTSRRTAGKKLQEPEGDIESIVIDEEVSFRRASLGDQGFEDFEDNGKEGTTNGNVCVSPDIDQANNEPSLAGQSEKTVEGEKDVWATIVKTTRKDPRAQKLSYKKIPIVLKGDEKTDKGSQLPAESGNPLVNENSGGLFTGIRTYGRKRTSARKKNSNGDDESMDAMLSPKEKLPESNKVEESENRDVVERMSDVVVDKRTVEDTIGKDDTLERLAEDDWISEVGARPALSAEEASPENSSYKMMAEDRSGCSEKYDEDDTKSGELDDTLLVPDELTNNDDGILETGPPNGDGNEKESGPSGRRTGKKTNTESDSTKLIKKDAIPRMEDQTEEIHSLVSEVNTGPLDCAETARRSGRSRKFGKNAAREIVGAPSAKVIKENSEAHELEVNGPTDNAESTRKGAKSRRNKKKAANKVREVVPPVTEEQGEVNVSQEQESSQNGLAMDDGPTAFQEQTKGMDVQISEVDMALMNGVPSVDVRIVRKGGKKQRKKGKNTDKDGEIKATIGQEMVVVAEVECNPLTEAENVKKNGRARKKQPSYASTLQHKEEDKQEKTLVVGCPPEEDVRKSGRSRNNDKKRKEVVEETSEVRDEHDTEACQQEMVEVVQNGLAMDDGPTAFQEQTEGMDIQISEVDMALMNGVPSVDEWIAKKSGRQRKKGKNTDKDEEIKATIGQEMVVVAEVECNPLTEAENVKKNGRARKKQPSYASTLQHKEEDKQEKALVVGCPPEEDVRKSGRSRKNDKKRKEVVEETSEVRDEHDTEACQQEMVEVVQNGLAMDDGPTAFQEQTEGMDIQISEVDMAVMNGVPLLDERIAKKSGRQRKKGKNTDKDEEIIATIGQEMVVVPEVECIPVTDAENVKKNGRARKKQPSNASTLQHKEEDKQEKALVMGLGCPPEEDVRKSGRSRKNDKKRKEVVEETSQVREEHDTEAWQQETEKIVASETTPPKSTEDVGKMGRTRPKRGRARDLSPVGAEMEEKTAGIDTDQRQKVRKSGRSRKTVGQQEELSVPADSVESQEDKNDIQEAVGVDESEGIAVKRGRRLPRSSVEAKKKRNNIEAYERLETDVKDPLEPAELENEKSFGKGVDDNNNNEVLKNVVIDVVETVERAVQEDTHCVDSEQNGKKNTRQTDYEELGHLMSAAGDVSLGAEKMMAETVMSTIGGSDTQTLKKGGRSRKKGGKAARKPTKSEFPVIVATEGVTSDGGVANEDTSEVVLPEVVTGNQEIPHDQLSSIVESEPDIPLDSLTDDQQRLAEKQQIKSEPITPLVQVLTLDIKDEIITPVAPLGSVLSTVKDLKDEPITPNVPAQQQCVISVGDENLENEGILTNVPAQQLSQEPFSSDRVCDKEVERLTDVGLALDGNRKRRLMSEDEMSPAKALKPKEYQSGFWDIVDGETESECNVSSAFEVTADGLDLNGNDVTGPKGAVEVEADIHAEVDGTSATAKPPSDELCSLKSCNRLQGIIGSMATADCDNIDEIVVEDLLVQAGGRKRGGNRGKATKRKPDEEEVKEVRKSKRNKKFEEDGAEAGGSNSGEAKPGRCYKIGPSRKKDMYVGAHVSISGGLHKAAANAVEVGARSFGLFLGSQRQWSVKPIPEEIVQKFRKACKEHNFPPHLILPHGSYLMNLGSPKPDLLQKSRDLLVKELSRCELLGLELFNFHPGSTAGETSVEDSILKIAESINIAHSKTKYCKTVIENMSCQGYTIGGKFSELRAIIDLVKNKSRIGVCLDTCHAMAAGYDLSTEEGFNRMMDDFTSIIGLDYLVGVHLNDSVGKVGCHKDLHENIGQGKIGRAGFRRIMNDARFQNLPMILETPANMDDVIEIKLLYMMCKNE